jgi:putative CocE/NonD family hydrolase
MGLYPAERWSGGSIPIFFHLVLSLFLIILATYHKQSFPTVKIFPAKKIVRWCIYFVITFAISAWSVWQVLPAVLAYHYGLGLPRYAVRIQQNVKIPLSDGVNLAAEIFHPQHAGSTPTLLVRIPLSKSFKNDLFLNLISRVWAEHGYTVIIQGTRGRFGSGGIFCPLVGERSDGVETLSWLKAQPWYNGQCAMWGGSSFGYTAWSICDKLQSNASVIEVYESSTNFRKMFYPGGAFSLSSALSWAINSHGRQDLPEWPDAASVFRSANGFPACDSDKRAVGNEIPFFRAWCQHTTDDEFWQSLNVSDRLIESQAPVLSIAGWYDPFLPSQLEDFINLRRLGRPEVAQKSQLIIGPWTHAGEVVFPNGQKSQPFRLETIVTSLPWFDYILRSGAVPVTTVEAPVRIFVMGKNEWRDEHEWPLARTAYTPLFLQSDAKSNRKLSFSTAGPNIKVDHFTYEPNTPVPTAGGAMIGIGGGIERQNQIECRDDVLVYTSPNLKKDLEITGPVSAVLFVSTSAPQTDFTVKLVEVQPDGGAFNICDGILRHSFERSSKELNSTDNSCVHEIKIDLWPTSIVIAKGHRIRVEISSSNFPRYDRNPNTSVVIPTAAKAVPAHQSVYQSQSFRSRIILPVISQSTVSCKIDLNSKEYFDEQVN